MNLLRRINAELGGDFDLDDWSHYAFYNGPAGRVEMHLHSARAQTVHIGSKAFDFEEDELIWTECSYKYDLAGFAALAGRAGGRVAQVWAAAGGMLSVEYIARPAR